MAAASKLRLSVLLLFLQLFFYLYVLPRGNGAFRQEDPGGGFLLSRACQVSYPPASASSSGRTFFLQLAGNCGIKLQKPEKPPPPPPPVIQSLPEPQVLQPPPVEICTHPPPAPEVIQPPSPKDPEEDTNRSGNLIYQIIMVLLFLSVSFALADCFQERAKKRANPDRHDGLSRRMSLADLTMSRHARRESQASYRPIGLRTTDIRAVECMLAPKLEQYGGVKRQPLVSRSCSHDLPTKAKTVLRQASCPLLEDDATTERRRVRMIQRH